MNLPFTALARDGEIEVTSSISLSSVSAGALRRLSGVGVTPKIAKATLGSALAGTNVCSRASCHRTPERITVWLASSTSRSLVSLLSISTYSFCELLDDFLRQSRRRTRWNWSLFSSLVVSCAHDSSFSHVSQSLQRRIQMDRFVDSGKEHDVALA